MEGIHGAGKGDTYRKIDYDKWSENYDAIFKKKVSDKNGSKGNRSKDRRTNSKSSGNRRK